MDIRNLVKSFASIKICHLFRTLNVQYIPLLNFVLGLMWMSNTLTLFRIDLLDSLIGVLYFVWV